MREQCEGTVRQVLKSMQVSFSALHWEWREGSVLGPGLFFPGRFFVYDCPPSFPRGDRLMRTFGEQAAYVVTHPGTFTLCVLRAFRANQGLLLAGAVAYYTLLSIVPLLILMLIALSQLIDEKELLATLARYLEWLTPGQSEAVIGELANFLDHRGVIGWVLLATMVFFSSLAFTVLENAMSVIFLHRVVIRRRRFLVSAIIPYCYIVFLGLGLLLVTLVSGSLQVIGAESVDFLGRSWSLRGVSGVLLYSLGVIGEILVLTSIYLVMPVGRPSWRHALVGAIASYMDLRAAQEYWRPNPSDAFKVTSGSRLATVPCPHSKPDRTGPNHVWEKFTNIFTYR